MREKKFKRFIKQVQARAHSCMELAKLCDSERAAVKTLVNAVEACFARVKRKQRSLHRQNTVVYERS